MHKPRKLDPAPAPTQTLPDRDLEAARYALLQRLAPAIRHHIAGAFQPIMMLASAMERVAQMPEPDLPRMSKHGASIHGYARSGATAGLSVFTWVSCAENPTVPINAMAEEMLGLLATDLALREFSVDNQTGECKAEWPRQALREAYAAALIALTDAAPSPARVLLDARSEGGAAVLYIVIQGESGRVQGREGAYRALEWHDVELLAAANDVLLERTPDGVRLRLA